MLHVSPFFENGIGLTYSHQQVLQPAQQHPDEEVDSGAIAWIVLDVSICFDNIIQILFYC
jgi:hypothetical protein